MAACIFYNRIPLHFLWFGLYIKSRVFVRVHVRACVRVCVHMHVCVGMSMCIQCMCIV